MRKLVLSALVLLLIAADLSFITGCIAVSSQPEERIRVIVGFKNKPDVELIRKYHGSVKYVYNVIPSIACSLPKDAIDALKKIPNIAYVEPDGVVHAVGQTLPWGVNRIDAELVHPYNKGTGVKIAVIDSGVDYSHPDLDANIAGGESFVDYTSDYIDDNGHGTHVAGIIAAENNGIGVVGVAPEAKLYALKVLDSEGYGYLSDVIEAVEWSMENDMQIISMSLGTNTDYTPLQEACDNAYANGVLLVAAAGNDGSQNPLYGENTVDYPAQYDSVIAVGATKKDDTRATWSSTGPQLELIAPGVNIYSTYLNNAYATLDGTSMACPHVTGVAALVLANPISPIYDLDDDGAWDPAEVRKRLQDTADDLGGEGHDYLYGYGLVDADEAAPEVDTTPPSKINDLTATAGAYPDIHLIWTPATDDKGVDHYNIYRSTTGDIDKETDFLAAASGTATTYIDSTGTVGETYYYAVCGVDSAGNEAELSNIASATVAEPTAIHVESINANKRILRMGRVIWVRGEFTVVIVDADGGPVEGATVYAHWSGLVGGKVFGVTDSDGRVVFKSRYVRNLSGVFTLTIDDVSKDGCVYDQTANGETSDSITVYMPN